MPLLFQSGLFYAQLTSEKSIKQNEQYMYVHHTREQLAICDSCLLPSHVCCMIYLCYGLWLVLTFYTIRIKLSEAINNTLRIFQISMSCEDEVLSIRKKLEKMTGDGADQTQALDLLNNLGSLRINLQILTSTR